MLKYTNPNIFLTVVFSQKRVLRKIFGSKRDDVFREWRKLHSEELHNLYSFPDIIRQIKSWGIR
jgi:hypothetical protein